MPNKRFLGLGFTFAATDKGLEKKLKGIRSNLSGISEYLEDIGSQAADANDDLSAMVSSMKKATKFKTSRTAKTTKAKADKAKASKATRVPKSKMIVQPVRVMNFRDIKGSFISKPTTAKGKVSAQVARAAKPKGRPHFRRLGDVAGLEGVEGQIGKMFEGIPQFAKRSAMGQMKDMKVTLTKSGKLSKRSVKDVADNSSRFVKSMDQISTAYPKLLKAFNGVKRWFSDVAGSTDRLLKSIGIDFSQMIPDEFKALGGVIRSVVQGPIDMIKGLLSSGRDKTRDGWIKEIRANTESMVNQIGGSKSNSVVSNLRRKDDKGGGLLGKLWSFIKSPFAFLGKLAIVGWLVKQFKNFGSILQAVGSWLGKLPQAFRMLWYGVTSLSDMFFSSGLVRGLVQIGSRIAGLAEGFAWAAAEVAVLGASVIWVGAALKGMWWSISNYGAAAFSSLWAGLKSFGAGLWNVITFATGKIASLIPFEVKMIGRTIYEGFVGVLKKIGEMFSWENIKWFVKETIKSGEWYGSQLTKEALGIVKGAGDWLKSAGESMQGVGKKNDQSTIPIPIPGAPAPRAPMIDQTNQQMIDRQYKQLQEQKETNELLRKTHELMEEQRGGGNTSADIKVQLRTDQFLKGQMREAAASTPG